MQNSALYFAHDSLQKQLVAETVGCRNSWMPQRTSVGKYRSMEEKIIEFVKRNNFLYDKRHKNYKNISLRDAKFKELADDLDMPVPKVKKRWRTLKDKFFREIKNANSGSGGASSTSRKQWKWMKKMTFLTDCKPNIPSTSVNFRSETLYEELAEVFSAETSAASTPEDSAPSSFSTKRGAVEREMREVLKMARDSLRDRGQERKPSSRLFFESLAQQAQEAQLPAEKMAILQAELLKTFNKIVYNV